MSKKKGSTKQGETSTKGKAAGKFGFPFDVEQFSSQFPDTWQLQDELIEEYIFLSGPEGQNIGAGTHALTASQDLEEIVNRAASSFEVSSVIESRPTAIGTTLWYFDHYWENDSNRWFFDLPCNSKCESLHESLFRVP